MAGQREVGGREPLATPDDVAGFLGVTTGALAQMRYQGTGPAFQKLGKTVRYRWEDVEAYVTGRTRTQTGGAA